MTPKDPSFRDRVKASFDAQTFMRTLGVRMAALEPGHCVLEMPVRPDLCQQNGFVHAGATTAIADTAAGYAAFSLMPVGANVLTVEFKLNLLNPAEGETLVARAQVIKPGRTLMVVRSDVFGARGGAEKLVATMLATMMSL
ncbi:thioesterase [Paramagnetospirillum kuznetsovii]|uniref:Medium/long-chain acyl-CoA thioesterase YigI n=1 Tax=Paramagnetospirillum kuznetsovii TaxID=2053833 RepID=A0A364NY55_9PROT|nr:PaaI family thioesterase [Paramagnetospirillum kuznetsovii]RAU21996.1 thioesterase [Paramagnetospirillum kuznetsovii]